MPCLVECVSHIPVFSFDSGKFFLFLLVIGGLDTSCILRWLLDAGYDVVCFLANVGQPEDFDAVEAKALKVGASKMIVSDLRREFIEEFCFRAIQCNAQYEGR